MSRYAQPTNIQDAVRMADRLAAILSRLGLPLSQARALDLVARISGLPDWARMRAGLLRLEGAQVPMADHAIRQIMRLDAERAEDLIRGVEAVWTAHLTEPERSSPDLDQARAWLRVALEAGHAWSLAHQVPFGPDLLLSVLATGTGRRTVEATFRRSPLLPHLLDLQLWTISDRISAPWAERLSGLLRQIPGYDRVRLLKGEPQPAPFLKAVEPRIRLVLAPLRELIEAARMEPAPDMAPTGIAMVSEK